MHLNAILDEVQQLYNMSDRLDTLAEQHPLVSEALITISGSLRNTATLLEVLVVTKIAPLSRQMPDLF
jgi:predicted AAA+ superfamily ATPase